MIHIFVRYVLLVSMLLMYIIHHLHILRILFINCNLVIDVYIFSLATFYRTIQIAMYRGMIHYNTSFILACAPLLCVKRYYTYYLLLCCSYTYNHYYWLFWKPRVYCFVGCRAAFIVIKMLMLLTVAFSWLELRSNL